MESGDPRVHSWDLHYSRCTSILCPKALCPEYGFMLMILSARDVASETDHCQLQQVLDKLAIWEGKWKMSFHPQKCPTLQVSRHRKTVTGSYSLHNHHLQDVTSAEYLGVKICSDLGWDSHIAEYLGVLSLIHI